VNFVISEKTGDENEEYGITTEKENWHRVAYYRIID